MADSPVPGRSTVSAYLYVPLLAVIALLQITVGPYLSILGAAPDFMLLGVASWGLLLGPREGLIWGFVGGFWLSLFSGGPFGVAALVLMAVGAMAGLGQSIVYRGRIVLPVIMATAASLLHALLWLGVLWVTGQSITWLDTLVRVTLPSTMLNALLILPAYALLRRLRSRIGHEVVRW